MLNYSKKETESIQSLFNLHSSYSSEYRLKDNELKNKKELLFLKPDLLKWKLSPLPSDHTFSDLREDKDLAFPYMLHEETLVVGYLRDCWGHGEAQLIGESQKFLD